MVKPRDRMWSPYAAGIVLGVLVVLSLVAIGAAPDPAAGIKAMAGRPDPDHSRSWWQVALLAGIAAGAFLSATLSHSRRRGQSRVWAAVLGTPSPRRRAQVAFAGGFVLLIGAGLAGGCLTGHGLSGVSQLALSSVIALAAMAFGGIAAGELLRRP